MAGEVEAFIRQCNARNWSRTMTYEALNVSRVKFNLMLETMEPMVWPKPGYSLGDQMRNQTSYNSPGHIEARKRSAETIRAQHRQRVGHLFGTKLELAAQAGITRYKLERRLKEGKTLAQALGIDEAKGAV